MKSSAHFAWVDALRGLSALAVVLFHVRVPLWVGWVVIRESPASFSALDRALAWLSLPMPFLGSSVMLFFLLSGFCVHFPHAPGSSAGNSAPGDSAPGGSQQASGRPLELRAYAWRRLGRIYPPYLAAVALSLALEAVASTCIQGWPGSSSRAIASTVFMVQNFGAGQITPNPSLWSLPVEVELYLAYPLFYWATRRAGMRWALLGAGVVSLATLALSLAGQLSGAGWSATEHFALYWIIWCAGAALAQAVKRGALARWQRWQWGAATGAAGVAVAMQLKSFSLPLQELAWATFYFFVLWWGLQNQDPLRALPARARAALTSLGSMSYSLYLIHFPFFALCGALWTRHFGSKPSNLLVSLCFAALCLPLALAFHRAIEAPSHRLAQRFGKPSASSPAPRTEKPIEAAAP